MQKYILISFILFAGCNADNQCVIQTKGWVWEVKQQLTTLDEHQYNRQEHLKKLKEIGIKPDTPLEDLLRRLKNADNDTLASINKNIGIGWKMSESIFNLWKVTGYCLFADIPCDKLVENADEISNRYRKFICEHGDKDVSELWLTSLGANIDLIKTEYGGVAIYRIADIVNFGHYYSSGDRCRQIPESYSIKAWVAMKSWLGENKESLQWDPFFQKFDNSSWCEKFELPQPVIEAIWAMILPPEQLKNLKTLIEKDSKDEENY